MKQKGFTLIELMVVTAITVMFGTMGIAGFNNYRQVQTLQTSGDEVATMLNLAKSRAQSQIKPSACTDTLNGYRVAITAPKTYALKVSCSGTTDTTGDTEISEQIKQLPVNTIFSDSPSFFFPVQKGGVETAGSIAVCGSDGKSKTIAVSSLGGISMQSATCTYYVPPPTPTPSPTPPTGSTPTPTPSPTPTPTPTSPPGSTYYRLTLSKSPKVGGTVTVTPTGRKSATDPTSCSMTCGSLCTWKECYFSSGTSVTFIAAPATPHYKTVTWSGACIGTVKTCIVSMDAYTPVIATFTSE
jgi:prepilin-type N-terminal cleavage/methylation domain-containing protein